MIRIHIFPKPAGWPVGISPFCIKTEAYCCLVGLPYKLVPALPFQAPRGKLPYIEHEGARIADSGFIQAYLKNRFGDTLDHGLDDRQLAVGHMLRRLVEESLYFLLLYTRWRDLRNWPATRLALFGALPPGARHTLGFFVRRGMLRDLYGQGYGRHDPPDIRHMAINDLNAIAAQLSGRAFALGDGPTSVDATLYAMLASILFPPLQTALKEEAEKLPVLRAYAERMREALAE